jgi:thioredoxin reductase
VDAVLLSLGFKADVGHQGLGSCLRQALYPGSTAARNNLPVYAAGDICKQPDVESLNLISTGFAEAAVAVITPTTTSRAMSVFPGHSSELHL